MAAFGLWVSGAGVVMFRDRPDISSAVIVVAGLGTSIAGVAGIHMGIARMKWKREYERVMGRSPFR
jgi:hypothetical protein